MATGGFDIAKAGWLYRQSSFLHRWKRNWFVLDRLGDLRYFESPDNPRAEQRIIVRAAVSAIKTGHECRKADLPESVTSRACLLELIMREGESMLLCADSPDDAKAWQIALEEARTLPPSVPPATTIITPPGFVAYTSPYVGSGYSGHVISNGATQVIQSPDGTTTIVTPGSGQQVVYVDDDRFRCYPIIYPVPLFWW